MNKSTQDDKYKFSLSQMLSTAGTGKTSATGTIGVFLCLISMLIIICSFFFYFLNLEEAEHILDFIDKAIIILGIGAALLGTRKVTGALCTVKGSNAVGHAEDIMKQQN